MVHESALKAEARRRDEEARRKAIVSARLERHRVRAEQERVGSAWALELDEAARVANAQQQARDAWWRGRVAQSQRFADAAGMEA